MYYDGLIQPPLWLYMTVIIHVPEATDINQGLDKKYSSPINFLRISLLGT